MEKVCNDEKLAKDMKDSKNGDYVYLKMLSYYFPKIVYRNSTDIIKEVVSSRSNLLIRLEWGDLPLFMRGKEKKANFIRDDSGKYMVDINIKDYFDSFGLKYCQ